MFGKLTLSAFRHDIVQMTGVAMMGISTLVALILLFYYKRWHWFWREWLTSVDPKKIGVMYLVLAFLMLCKGAMDAAMIRVQQLFGASDSTFNFLTSDHFQQVFSAHGSTMIFFVGMGVVFGMFNLIIPLQIGARDVAFPFLNAISFWLFFAAVALLNISLLIGDFSAAGWLGYPPLSGLEYSPGVGVDYWIWMLQIAGVGSLLAGINFLATIFMMRCPGMSLMKMPLFVWAALGALFLVVFAFPILTATLGMLSLDRLFGMHFFTTGGGGNPMMYINLIWAWGHPEVYILVLPAFGAFSEIVATFSAKRLFGYKSMVWAIIAITFLSFIVWLHHFFTMGAGANVNAFFGIMTMVIAIPTGVKVFNWLFTMFRGRVNLATPMLWFLGFVVIFTLGGMAGVLMSIPAADFQIHNSLFLIAHFHSVIIGGVLFGFFAGFTYWFPKIFGFVLDENLGTYAFWCWLIGFLLAFLPLYILGLMGATRRLDHYDASTGWQSLFLVAMLGVSVIFIGISLQIVQLIVSIKNRKKLAERASDPWNGRTLEWSTTSPPPFYNFAIIPVVTDKDPFWLAKQSTQHEKVTYQTIHYPKNTPLGIAIGMVSILFGFAIVWCIHWLTLISFLSIIALLIKYLSKEELETFITAEEVEKIERLNHGS